ncbi:hypothetical protein CRT23_25250 [Methylobacterium sp. V23]|nr:hypothetical protein CRT23_25250 [Methylobacterium sp. V23]
MRAAPLGDQEAVGGDAYRHAGTSRALRSSTDPSGEFGRFELRRDRNYVQLVSLVPGDCAREGSTSFPGSRIGSDVTCVRSRTAKDGRPPTISWRRAAQLSYGIQPARRDRSRVGLKLLQTLHRQQKSWSDEAHALPREIDLGTRPSMALIAQLIGHVERLRTIDNVRGRPLNDFPSGLSEQRLEDGESRPHVGVIEEGLQRTRRSAENGQDVFGDCRVELDEIGAP